MNSTREHFPNGPHAPHQGHHDGNTAPTETEVQTIVQSIRDASAATSVATTSLPGPSAELHRPQDPAPSHPQRPGEFDVGEYWDLASMAPLNQMSRAAIARLRAYNPPPFPLWEKLPLSRRAAVLILLYADRQGDLRVVLTMRAASLRSFSGHAAFPGGKADTLEETPYQIARREAWEEIGLPIDDNKIPKPFRIEHLCCLPHSLAKTELAVRPCVALLHSGDDDEADEPSRTGPPSPTVDESLMPRLDAKEVAAVFSGPLHNFLLAEDEVLPGEGEARARALLPRGKWYEGRWAEFHEAPWRVHYFYVPVNHQRVTKPRVREGGLAAIAEHLEDDEEDAGRYMVWGMTGRMLVDTARVAYAREPEFEHNKHFGDEAIIERLSAAGRLTEKKRPAAVDLVQHEANKAKEGSKM
ncbi:NUDIX domain-containing protein [Diaporthe helianthi]|uniref:NUDIX domain-containing protein n=1 Tax=Diaporthe helianthi TaxID=158607 RepID=A0A2P5HKC6_DIAHE|nr:NUDIX domain-containing protein [Diaporthe helianthi]